MTTPEQDLQRTLSNLGHMAETLVYLALGIAVLALVIFAARSHR